MDINNSMSNAQQQSEQQLGGTLFGGVGGGFGNSQVRNFTHISLANNYNRRNDKNKLEMKNKNSGNK